MSDSQWVALIWLGYCCGVATVMFVLMFMQTRDRIKARRGPKEYEPSNFVRLNVSPIVTGQILDVNNPVSDEDDF